MAWKERRLLADSAEVEGGHLSGGVTDGSGWEMNGKHDEWQVCRCVCMGVCVRACKYAFMRMCAYVGKLKACEEL